MFNEEQIEYMKKIGISLKFDNLSEDDYINIEDKVSEHLQKYGYDEDYEPTDDGKICESILDLI
jgi:hypothetical protein|nr:MAG TPA: hypothetical protein [Caudoviricetes sp.]